MSYCMDLNQGTNHFSTFVDYYFSKTKKEFPFLSDEEVVIFLTQDFQEKHAEHSLTSTYKLG